MKSLKAATTVSLTLLALTHCGGSTQDDTGTVSSGISSSKALSAVTTQEATRGCAQMKDAVEARFSRASVKTGLCTMSALLLSSSESSCSSARDACLNGSADSGDAPAVNPAPDFECQGTNIDSWQGCSATVGQLETCLNEMLDAAEATLMSYSCADAGQQQAESNADCAPPPLQPNGEVAIDPETGQPYVDHREDCEASRADLTSPTIPKSCQALQTQCSNLEMFGAANAE
jgi:hypothetical protein